MTTIAGIPMIIIALPVFVLLFTVIRKTLQQHPLLGDNADTVLSFCVAVLCVISVFRVTPVPTAASSQESVVIASASEDTTKEEKSDRPVIEFILLPYAALLLTLPFVWLLKLFTGHSASGETEATDTINRIRSRASAKKDTIISQKFNETTTLKN